MLTRTDNTPGPGLVKRSWFTIPRDVLSSIVWFAYDLLISRPLRAFYFEGPIWHNQPPEEVCYEMTGVEARHWVSSPENIARCQMEMERRFQSWDRTAMTFMYFTLLFFVMVKLFYCICNTKILRFTGQPDCDHSHCNCNFNHNESDVRPVTREELRELLKAAMNNQRLQICDVD